MILLTKIAKSKMVQLLIQNSFLKSNINFNDIENLISAFEGSLCQNIEKGLTVLRTLYKLFKFIQQKK